MINILFGIENILNNRILAIAARWIEDGIYSVWMRILVIIGILFLSAILPFQSSSYLYLLGGIGLIIGVGFILMIMNWPQLGLLALIGSIIIPVSGPSNSNATMGLAALLIALWILNMMRQHNIALVSSLPILPLFALVIAACLAFGVGQLPWYTFAEPVPLGAQLGGLSLYVLSAGVFLIVAHQVKDIYWLEWMTWLFLAVGSIYIIGRMIPPIGAITNELFLTGADGSLLWVWLITFFFSQAFFNSKLSLLWRGVLGAGLLATLYVDIVQNWEWNSGWVPPLISVGVILVAAKPPLGFLAGLGGIGGIIVKLQEVSEVVMVGDNSYSLSTRLEAWAIVWDITKVNPILGLGPANYYNYTPLFPIRGYAVRFNSHSQYIDLIAQTGLLGFACFFWFFGAVGWVGWKLRNQVPAGFAQAYVYGAIGGVAGTFVSAFFGDWVIPFFYNINLGGFRASMLSWLFLGGLIALQQIYAAPTPKLAPIRNQYQVQEEE